MTRTKILIFSLVAFLAVSCGDSRTRLTKTQAKNLPFQKLLDSIYAKNPEAVGILAHIEAPNKKISWSGAAGFSDK